MFLKKQLKMIKEKAGGLICEGIHPITYYEQEKYIKAYEDTVWAICDEFSWALPAHIDNALPMEDYRGFIDLFAAETGFALAESSHLLKKMLEEKLLNRIEFEVRGRIIDSYMSEKEFSWEKSHSNWASVCAGSVGAAFLYLADDEEIRKALPRIEKTLDYFLSGYGADGVCREGYGYWSYGFGFFVYFAELLRQYSDGEKYAGKILKANDKEFEADISDAYGDKAIRSVVRKIHLEDRQITVRDMFVFDEPFEITERLVTCIKPGQCGAAVKLGSVGIVYDRDKFSREIHTDTYKNHEAKEQSVFFADFKSLQKTTRIEAVFNIIF